MAARQGILAKALSVSTVSDRALAGDANRGHTPDLQVQHEE